MAKSSAQRSADKFWNFVEETARKVDGWPDWKKGTSQPRRAGKLVVLNSKKQTAGKKSR